MITDNFGVLGFLRFFEGQGISWSQNDVLCAVVSADAMFFRVNSGEMPTLHFISL